MKKESLDHQLPLFPEGEIIFDPEIEKTARANRRAKRLADGLVEPTSSFSDSRQDLVPRKVNEVGSSNLEGQISELTTLMKQVVLGQVQSTKTCGICFLQGHTTDACPQLQDEPDPQANAISGFSNQQRQYDP
ncbi:hypothetical protein CRG98_041378 [Punica granatum]|uniref:Uncharacterized protein n=1 Tax=Punica granatum TaxID=22663 RepID=A0A2I0I2M6_PUNGR|nr:hypothetical protein CRG98_041378 [Punica granatum]